MAIFHSKARAIWKEHTSFQQYPLSCFCRQKQREKKSFEKYIVSRSGFFGAKASGPSGYQFRQLEGAKLPWIGAPTHYELPVFQTADRLLPKMKKNIF